MKQDLMNIREMCTAFNVTARTLRYYEQKELLSPLRDGQRRLYSHQDRARLTLILRGKTFGYSLEDIRSILDLYRADDTGKTQLTHAHALAEKHLTVLEQQRDELEQSIVALQDHIAWASGQLSSMAAENAA